LGISVKIGRVAVECVDVECQLRNGGRGGGGGSGGGGSGGGGGKVVMGVQRHFMI